MSTCRHAFSAVPESGGFDAYQPPSRLETERLSDDSPFLFGLHVDVNFHGGSKRIPNPIRDDPRLKELDERDDGRTDVGRTPFDVGQDLLGDPYQILLANESNVQPLEVHKPEFAERQFVMVRGGGLFLVGEVEEEAAYDRVSDRERCGLGASEELCPDASLASLGVLPRREPDVTSGETVVSLAFLLKIKVDDVAPRMGDF